MIEILNPLWGDLRRVFAREFQGMVVEPVTAEELRIAGEHLVSRLHEEMTQEERRFIVSVKEGNPQWDLLGVPGIENLPGVRWRLQNIRRMAPMKHREALPELHRRSANTDSAGLDRNEGSSQSLSLLFHEFENFL